MYYSYLFCYNTQIKWHVGANYTLPCVNRWLATFLQLQSTYSSTPNIHIMGYQQSTNFRRLVLLISSANSTVSRTNVSCSGCIKFVMLIMFWLISCLTVACSEFPDFRNCTSQQTPPVPVWYDKLSNLMQTRVHECLL